MRNLWSLVVPLLLYNVIVLPSLHYVQVWDGFLYWKCLLDATKESFSLERFVCYGHPPGFMMLYGLLQYFDHGNVMLLNGFSFLLGNLAVLSFAGIVRKLFKGAGALERTLMTLVFACHPVVLGSTLHFNLDIGILFFSIYLLYFLLCDRKIWVILCGIVLVFTKEIGVFFYFAIVSIHALVFLFRPEQGISGFLRLLRERSMLLIPIPLFPIFALVRSLGTGQLLAWGVVPENIVRPHRVFLSDFTSTQDLLLMLQDIFVLNFLWVSSLLILFACIIFFYRWFFRVNDGSRLHDDARGFLFIGFLFILSILVLSTALPTHNLRYFVVLYPLALLLFFFSLRYVRMRLPLHCSVLGLIISLNLLSVFRSVDPLSHVLYGTFSIGDHAVLSMAPVHRECCGYGRDQLVYSLEFVWLSKLQDAFFQRIRPDAYTVIATDPDAWHGFNSGEVDPVTFRRTATGGILPRYVNPFSLPPEIPQELFFVAFPNFDSTEALDVLLREYRIDAREEIRIHGYALPFLRLHRRSAFSRGER